MGWTGHFIECPKGKERMAVVAKLEELNWENEHVKDEVIGSAMYSSTCYYAIRRTKKSDGSSRVFATVCLTYYDKIRRTFNIKVMDEIMGPVEARMPRRLLNMLTTTDNEYALDWRRRCEENLKGNLSDLAKLPWGTKLRVNHPSGKIFIIASYRGRRAYIASDHSCRITAQTLKRLGYAIV